MFSIEEEFDATVITIVDNSATYEDYQVILGEDVVYFRQWNEVREKFDVISITPLMFKELVNSLNYSEGTYLTKDS